MLNRKIFSGCLALCGVIALGLPVHTIAQEAPAAPMATFSLADIAAAKEMLAHISLKHVWPKYTELNHPIAYVLGNSVTDEKKTIYAIVHKKYVYTGKGKKRKRGTVVDRLEVLDKSVVLTYTRWNYRNTAYEVSVDGSTEWAVLANRYPSFSDNSEILYVPYSKKLHDAAPGLVENGLAYLDRLVDEAISEIQSKSITWRFQTNGRPLVEIAEDPILGKFFLKRLIKTIIAIEHIDHDEFATSDAAYLIEKVLVTIGGNEVNAFNASISYAGAGGIAQFIKSTYDAVRRSDYPEAKLIPDFMDGMLDHKNAVQAMALLIDRELDVLTGNLTIADYLQETPRPHELALQSEYGFPTVYAMRLWLLVTAAYNGGTGPGGEKIAKAIRAQGTEWFLSSATQLDTLRDKIGNVQSALKRTKNQSKIAALKKELADLNRRYASVQNGALSPKTGETPIYLQKSLPAHEFFSQPADADQVPINPPNIERSDP